MNVNSPRERDVLRPLNVVMIFIVTLTLAGGFLLLSAAETETLVDGAIAWHAESPLRAVVQLLCLNYQFPTINPGEIKGFMLSMGAGLAVLAVSIALLAREPGREGAADAIDAVIDSPSRKPPQIAPLLAAQFLIALYLLWSFASSRWSSAPQLAVGGSILVTIQVLWAFGIGVGLNPRAARIVAQIIVGLTALTGAIAVWYYFGRNPVLRAKFPFGNPNFLSSALIPGIILGVALIAERATQSQRSRLPASLGSGMLVLALIGISVWAFLLADSRGAAVGLAAGLLALLFFAAPGRWKAVALLAAIGLAVCGWWYLNQSVGQSLTGRNETLRFRGYAWSYAWRMFVEKPFTGHGQGGFVLAGDSHAVADVLADPLVFESRIDHAHNEWLEIMADLGSVGIFLFAAAILITLLTAMSVLRRPSDDGRHWVLIGLLAALVGLIVEEASGVGLRIAELPLVFYTILGLVWAQCSPLTDSSWGVLLETRGRRLILGPVGVAFGLIVLVLGGQDFSAARSAFRTEQAFLKGEYDEAVRLASHAVDRLYPQRALVNLYRLGEAYVASAEKLRHRGSHRELRAGESTPANPRLLALAEDDYRAADEFGKNAGHILKELITRSPGFLNHGQLEFRIHSLQAQIASIRGDNEEGMAYLKNARMAIERELLRQPFNAEIALEFAAVAGPSPDYAEVLSVLARPLRFNRITDDYVEMLRGLARDPEFDRQIEGMLIESAELAAAPAETWAPERLRLIATLHFLRGDYERAADALESAAGAYARLPESTSLGAAACHAELADCCFFADPDQPGQAIRYAEQAIELAPSSRMGRELKLAVRQRMIHYYLAADDETSAGRMLREIAPAGVDDRALLEQLGIRLRRLCESLLLQRRDVSLMPKPTGTLVPKLQRWIQRSIEINPEDFVAHFLAADLAFHAGDEAGAARHLETALQLGLPPMEAAGFLAMARAKKPDSPILESMLHLIETYSKAGSPAPSQP